MVMVKVVGLMRSSCEAPGEDKVDSSVAMVIDTPCGLLPQVNPKKTLLALQRVEGKRRNTESTFQYRLHANKEQWKCFPILIVHLLLCSDVPDTTHQEFFRMNFPGVKSLATLGYQGFLVFVLDCHNHCQYRLQLCLGCKVGL